MESQFNMKVTRRNGQKSMGGSSASSVKSGQSNSNNTEYLKSILTNVFTVCGYKHFIRYIAREGKAKLSIQKVVK